MAAFIGKKAWKYCADTNIASKGSATKIILKICDFNAIGYFSPVERVSLVIKIQGFKQKIKNSSAVSKYFNKFVTFQKVIYNIISFMELLRLQMYD